MNKRHKHIIQLSRKESAHIQSIIRRGKHSARVITRARIFLLSDKGEGKDAIASRLEIGRSTVQRIRDKYGAGGIDQALYDAPRPGQPPRITDEAEAHLVALATSSPPEGEEKWTLELLKERMIQDGKAPKTITTVALWKRLDRRKIKPGREKMWCIPAVTPEFTARMENILDLSTKLHDSNEPVLCFDEKSKQLLKDTRSVRPAKARKPRRRDYEYKRNGTRHIFLAVEPKGGWRERTVTRRRTKRDFAEEIKRIIELPRYRQAKRIHLVLDNLNTHFASSFLETFGKRTASRILKRIVFHHTPTHASWLNRAEIELSILSRTALSGRIDTETLLASRIERCWDTRNSKGATIQWRFTKEDARRIFKYDRVQN